MLNGGKASHPHCPNSTNSIRQTDTMKLIRALLDRLSENFVVSVSEKLELATEPSNNPPLRLVSDKASAFGASGHGDPSLSRPFDQSGGCA